ncbi:MAG TPA: hypothetical protein VFR41_03405 [Acidimicrobiia bacterium]|nr:hypothetical protein [Acidimicrobiia bacterium]
MTSTVRAVGKRERSLISPRRRWRWILLGTLALGVWMVIVIPSGIDIAEVFVFTAPAAALGVFTRFVSCAFARSQWNWRMSLRAALISVALLPPFLAALVTLAGLQRPEQLLTLFVLGAWIALALGLLAGALNIGTVRPRRGSLHND